METLLSGDVIVANGTSPVQDLGGDVIYYAL
jgi:hypothetical protein